MSTTENAIVTNEIVTRPASAETIRAQIGRGVLMSCGARNLFAHQGEDSDGTFVDGLQFDCSRGGRKLIVVRAANDEYTVERVRLIARGARRGECISEDHRSGVYCEDLARVVRELGDV